LAQTTVSSMVAEQNAIAGTQSTYATSTHRVTSSNLPGTPLSASLQPSSASASTSVSALPTLASAPSEVGLQISAFSSSPYTDASSTLITGTNVGRLVIFNADTGASVSASSSATVATVTHSVSSLSHEARLVKAQDGSYKTEQCVAWSSSGWIATGCSTGTFDSSSQTVVCTCTEAGAYALREVAVDCSDVIGGDKKLSTCNTCTVGGDSSQCAGSGSPEAKDEAAASNIGVIAGIICGVVVVSVVGGYGVVVFMRKRRARSKVSSSLPRPRGAGLAFTGSGTKVDNDGVPITPPEPPSSGSPSPTRPRAGYAATPWSVDPEGDSPPQPLRRVRTSRANRGRRVTLRAAANSVRAARAMMSPDMRLPQMSPAAIRAREKLRADMQKETVALS